MPVFPVAGAAGDSIAAAEAFTRARDLGIGEKAVVNHISNIYNEIDLPVSADDHRRVLAVLRYLTR